MTTTNISLNGAVRTTPADRNDWSQDESLNGRRSALSVERAIAELRRGRVLSLRDEQRGMLVAAIETITDDRFRQMNRIGPPWFAITGQRAAALGLVTSASEPQMISMPGAANLSTLAAIAGLGPRYPLAAVDLDGFKVAPCTTGAAAALALCKHARLVPAACIVDATVPDTADILSVSVSDVHEFEKPRREDLQWVSDARVPLAGHENCRLVLFRDARDGTEHVAVLVGAFDSSKPVPVRVHSACLTGDLLGSLRCDCGDQLRNAVDQLGTAGGGVLLYLAQEGRGIGLANKLRAYHLQDSGLDTLDADHALGFQADERSFVIAALMLRQLDITRIRLLTNNPAKSRQLQDAGIEVVDRISLAGAVNEHNARYVRAKQERAGHLPVDAD